MKKFIITVDTEGDNLWNYKQGQPITTENAKYIPKFQELCEEFGFKPAYLINYEMAQNDEWVNYAKQKASLGLCEIGMHIHAWNSPPEYRLENIYGGNAYITEYPRETVFEKIEYLTKYLQNRFETEIKSARSGRWATNDTYFDALKENAYICDCSFTPGLDLSHLPGCSANLGSNYKNVEKSAHIHKSGIVEVPMTTRNIHHFSFGTPKHRLKTFIKGDDMWLRPHRKSLEELLFLSAKVKNNDYLEFMIHSSELMPTGNPYFKTQEDVDKLYSIMKDYFHWVSQNGYTSNTLSEYSSDFKSRFK